MIRSEARVRTGGAPRTRATGDAAVVKIEVLYLEGCPNVPPTLARVREVVAELGVRARIVMIKVKDRSDAERRRFPGSPTVRVNGEDVEPSARTCADYAWACRRYGCEGVPPRAIIVHAIRQQARHGDVQ